jgi:hypothetical protein
LYLQIDQQMKNELWSSKDYYLLGIQIFKVLHLDKDNRNIDLNTFLDDCFHQYQKLIENSCVFVKN